MNLTPKCPYLNMILFREKGEKVRTIQQRTEGVAKSLNRDD